MTRRRRGGAGSREQFPERAASENRDIVNGIAPGEDSCNQRHYGNKPGRRDEIRVTEGSGQGPVGVRELCLREASLAG